MKKPIAVKINNKEEYELAIEALDKAGFKEVDDLTNFDVEKMIKDEFFTHIIVDPAYPLEAMDYLLDNECVICGTLNGDEFDVGYTNIDYEEVEILTIKDFIIFFATMTEKNVREFLDSYLAEGDEEIDVPEDTEERHNTYLEIVTMPDRISITNISQEMRELIKVHWEIDATVNTETFGFVAEIDTADFLDFCKEFIIADLDKDDLLFITACSLALLQIEDKSMSSIRVLI